MATVPQLNQTEPSLRGRAHVNLTWRCNFTCSYCFQNGLRRGKPEITDLGAWDRAFDRLAGRWRIHLTGGEPFVARALVPITRSIARRHAVSIVTNLSAPQSVIEAFVEAAGDALETISASWHREHRPLDVFVERVVEVRRILPASAEIVVSVVIDDSSQELVTAIAKAAATHGLRFLIRNRRSAGQSE